jgi:ADP-dependent NAD(P)H-hydrate dehydratase / NAD(P)H-hydrate epimerase
MNALYTVEQIRAIEHAALAQLPPGTLMRRAGEAAAKSALQLLGTMHAATHGKVLVLAGPGNNGGDALEAAWRLADAGMEVTVLPFSANAEKTTDVQQALQRTRQSAARIAEPDKFAIAGTAWNLVVDGLFGIGLKRPVDGNMRAAIEKINAMHCPVLAIDVPSGLDADTGAVIGSEGVAVRATRTITFIGDKPGLHTLQGRDYAGTVETNDLDVESRHFPAAQLHLNDPAWFSASLRPRLHDSHKGSYGDAIIVGGAHGMTGAPVLAARAAAFSGAGRVYAAFVGEVPASDDAHPELMCRPAQSMEFAMATVVAGPGLGTSAAALELLRKMLAAPSLLVLDADALNLIAAHEDLQRQVVHRAGNTLLTPHPLEASRLLGISTTAVQADRVAAARELANRFQAVAILKGSGTIIAAPGGGAMINTTGNPGLATAGSGDVLSGVCGSLLAQGWPVWQAALGAVWLHGRAADVLVEQGIGPIGLTAGELIPAIRQILNKLVAERR